MYFACAHPLKGSIMIIIYIALSLAFPKMVSIKVRQYLGSITSRCSGKWARTHPPKEIKDQRPDPGDSENRA